MRKKKQQLTPSRAEPEGGSHPRPTTHFADGDPGRELKKIIKRQQIPVSWSPQVLALANQYVTLPDADRATRQVLHHLGFVTIDGDDSKDFDDAVYCEPHGHQGWRLWVAIADVSAFVPADSALDREAEKRGNSVYFADQVIPMLPEILSNEWCSLKPHQPRLVVVADMQIDRHGQVTHSQFYRAEICSQARLTYNQVSDFLDHGGQHPQADLIQRLAALFQTLIKARKKRNALDFDIPAPKLVFDQHHQLIRIDTEHRLIAHRIIEECMLAANVAVAQFLRKAKWPGPFRAHLPPVQEKWNDMLLSLRAFGIKIPFFSRKPSNRVMVQLFDQIVDLSEHRMLSFSMLRSLSQAHYSPEAIAHFGLDYNCYCHFTSPIRRYADLMVHRALLAILDHQHQHKTLNRPSVLLQKKVCDHISVCERRADEATRAMQQFYICSWLAQKTGQCFDAKITYVTNYGLFAHLEGYFIEGLIHVSTLGQEYFHFDEQKRTLTGESSGQVLQAGQSLKVKLIRVNASLRHLDLIMIV